MAQPKPELTIDLLLANSCSNPEDFREYEKWDEEEYKPWYRSETEPRPEYPHYKGWMSYRIELCCTNFVVIARQIGDGKFEIREYIQQD
jgi:hypothetical protein